MLKLLMQRLRKNRKNQALRDKVAETHLSVKDLVVPLFVIEGSKQKRPIASMPGIFQFSVDTLVKEAREIYKLGIPAILLFGVPSKKGIAQAYSKDGIVQKAVRELKRAVPKLTIITDVCLCSYTKDGHCEVKDNDSTVKILAKIAVSHAQAGADIVAPSAMMDGQVGAIRKILDIKGYRGTGIMGYSVKYASNFYGPFREAAECAPKHGDRKTYQMDFRNSDEALREVAADIEEGADMVMVKPALAYLDIIRRVKDNFKVPLAAFNVSGEYALFNGKDEMILEVLTAIKRAGADIIITYHAKEAAGYLA